jgi:hypothetical protein
MHAQIEQRIRSYDILPDQITSHVGAPRDRTVTTHRPPKLMTQQPQEQPRTLDR